MQHDKSTVPYVDLLKTARHWASDWMFNQALPLWWQSGADHVNGGFHEKLDQKAQPVGAPTRVRVQARQIYVYAQAGQLGWTGPWREAIQSALNFMLKHHSRADGLFKSAVTHDQTGPVDLYDQAFALFALAQVYQVHGRLPAILDRAQQLLEAMDTILAHPIGGYEEANPRVLPLRSNPHMHLLEALLAWVEIGVIEPFKGRAERLMELAKSHMLDPATGAVGEYFDGDWNFATGTTGSLREPGHQFEWAYLLDLGERLTGTRNKVERDRLMQFALRHGIDDSRNVAIFAVDEQGAVLDANARLWAQTEWLRACLVLEKSAAPAEKAALQQSALRAFDAVKHFLDTPTPGLWNEWMEENGSFRQEPSPASSLYHIVSAFRELLLAKP